MAPPRPAQPYAADFVPAVDEAEAHAAFAGMDTDHSNSLDARELRDALKGRFPGMDWPMTTLRAFVRLFDVDFSGAISYGEFRIMFAHLKQWVTAYTEMAEGHGVVTVTAVLAWLGKQVPMSPALASFLANALRADDDSDACPLPRFIQVAIELAHLMKVLQKRAVANPAGGPPTVTFTTEEVLQLFFACRG